MDLWNIFLCWMFADIYPKSEFLVNKSYQLEQNIKDDSLGSYFTSYDLLGIFCFYFEFYQLPYKRRTM